MTTEIQATVRLDRRISLPLLVFYGLGTILGAGIYVLVGQVAASAGMLAPLAFLVAGLVAGITALSYCRLVVAFPHSSGGAIFVEHGMQQPWLGRLVGYILILTGIVSSATLVNGFVGYLSSLIVLPHVVVVALVVLVMGALAIWGISQSLWTAALITVVEIFGLVWVIFLSAPQLGELPSQARQLWVPGSLQQWSGVMAGALLAFYAFVGFEDMVNIVEEVKSPARNMPLAILIALLTATLLYLLIAVAAVLSLSPETLAQSEAPLRDLIIGDHPRAANALVFISLFAIVNGVLAQVIMSSRMLYGLADRGQAPAVFASVAISTRTPWFATLVVALLIFAFAVWLPLVTLARLTSSILLLVFLLVNTSLWRLKREDRLVPIASLPSAPLLGMVLCISLLVFQLVGLLS